VRKIVPFFRFFFNAAGIKKILSFAAVKKRTSKEVRFVFIGVLV
jgi:hypothetical protein